MTQAERKALTIAVDLKRRLDRNERRMAYLERDKRRALDRARRAETEVLKLKGRLFLLGVNE